MSSGGYQVKNKFFDEEEYNPVEGYSTNTRNAVIPSGSSIVRGIYYMWNDMGFTGQGWMHDVQGGPTALYPDFQSNADVAQYVANIGNLDAVFSYWASHYNLEGWNNFYTAVGYDSGCMDVDQSSSN